MPSPTPTPFRLLLLGLTTATMQCRFAAAAVIDVSPGNATDTPVARAVAAAASGDTLRLTPGIYREKVRIDKPLTIRGESGAILEGATPLAGSWSPTQGLDGAFTLPISKRPYGLLLDGKFIAAIRFDRAQESGDWHWRTLLTKGTPLSGFDQIRALWIYHPAEKRIYLRLGSGAAPAAESLSIVLSDRALIEIAAPHVVVEGITLRGGQDAIRLSEGAKECVVRRCTITSYENTGIAIGGGATQCIVEENTITRGSLEEWQPTNDRRRENYEIWRVHKDVGHYDRVGIDLVRAGTGNRIRRNRLDRVFDGICVGDSSAESLDTPLPDPNHGRGTEIAGNIIENTRDSGIELGTGCIDVNVHHNTLRCTHGGFRFKLPRVGPVYVHHNHLIDGTPFNFWFSMDSSPAEGYIYHNTIEGGDEAALSYTSFKAKRDFATPHWHVLNNLVLNVRDGFFAQGKGTPPRDFKDSHNIVTNDARTAIGAGLDLSTYRQGRPLPGCEPGYFKGKAPDAGAGEHVEN